MRISVRVVPNAKKVEVQENDDGSLRVYVRAVPDDGKANKQVIEVLAKHFSVKKSQVSIISGAKSREKIIEIMD